MPSIARSMRPRPYRRARLNSKNEWNGPRIPRISVEVGARIITKTYNGQMDTQGPEDCQHDHDPRHWVCAPGTENMIKLWETSVRQSARIRTTEVSAKRRACNKELRE